MSSRAITALLIAGAAIAAGSALITHHLHPAAVEIQAPPLDLSSEEQALEQARAELEELEELDH